ncbi:unnamed protein product, partial [Scytosiphon promiscuus]
DRRRDVCRAASASQREGYMKALSATLTQLEDHPRLHHLVGGVSPTLEQLKLAQRGEIFALPLHDQARKAFFDTLLNNLQQAFGLEDKNDADNRPYFRFVLKSIGQKHMMREPILLGGEDDEVAFAKEHQGDAGLKDSENGGSPHPFDEVTQVNGEQGG